MANITFGPVRQSQPNARSLREHKASMPVYFNLSLFWVISIFMFILFIRILPIQCGFYRFIWWERQHREQHLSKYTYITKEKHSVCLHLFAIYIIYFCWSVSSCNPLSSTHIYLIKNLEPVMKIPFRNFIDIYTIILWAVSDFELSNIIVKVEVRRAK